MTSVEAGVADEWGLDAACRDRADRLTGWRWSVHLHGGHNVPAGAALLVVNRRAGVLVPAVAARAVRQGTGRALRLTGLPDIDPIGPWLRRVGGVVAAPAEIAGLLRAGELVAVWCDWWWTRPWRAGAVPAPLIAPATTLGVPIVPVGVHGNAVSRAVHLVCGRPVMADRADDPAEVAVEVRARVQRLLTGPARSADGQAEGAGDHEPLHL